MLGSLLVVLFAELREHLGAGVLRGTGWALRVYSLAVLPKPVCSLSFSPFLHPPPSAMSGENGISQFLAPAST